ncbi:hypothetical protein HK098_007290 [Nowakowskiella sp. JEL0407]|nr:hypothetical protein HK098_007278 [Nowakowskiella sp. JEL0407]KAJ3126696.1 hypothetical protein HK098_007290 [Nowakowskiella sp. JEL0407]
MSEELRKVELSLRRKLDIRLLPWVALGYIVNGLDRNNLNFAYVLGADDDLNLKANKGQPLADANLYFFITYVIFQVIGNSMIPRLRPSIFLPSIMIIWGLIAAAMALCQRMEDLFWLRAALGVAEAGYYPAVIYLLGTWYTKSELGLRLTIFTLGAQLGSALSGVISAALLTYIKPGGFAAWRALFAAEGLISVVVAIPGFWLLPDFPTNTKWMPDKERELAVDRLEAQGNQVKYTGYSFSIIKNILISPYFYLFLCVFPILNFLPAIISNFILALTSSGWNKTTASWMTVPVYVFAALTLPIMGYSSDRFKDRFYHSLGGALFSMILYCFLLVNGGNQPIWLLFIVVYVLAPMQSLYPITMGWVNETWRVDNQTRALAIALFNAFANIVPNFANRYIWLAGDAPVWLWGKSITVGGLAFLAAVIFTMGMLQRYGLLMPVDKDGKTALELEKEHMGVTGAEEIPIKVSEKSAEVPEKVEEKPDMNEYKVQVEEQKEDSKPEAKETA